MTTDLEDRLRSDLRRLADVIARAADDELPAQVETRRNPHRKVLAIAAVIVAGLTLAGVVALAAPEPRRRPPASSERFRTSKWRALPPSPVGPRANAVVVWTGREVIVWGGYRGNPNVPLALQTGETYDPATNKWRTIADNRWAHPGAIGVWTRDRLVILAKNGGAEYLPATNTWHDLAFLPNENGGGFLGAAWTGRQLLGVVAGPGLRTIAVARYDAGRNTWIIGTATPASSPTGMHRWSTAWTGKELVVSDGLRSTWAYDPGAGTWRALARLGPRVASSSITNDGGELVTVYREDGHLRAARAVGNNWRLIADSPNGLVAQPIAIAGSGTVFAIDASGQGTPMRADASTGHWVPLPGYPIRRGHDGAGAWTSGGLFVSGGLPPGTPGSFTNPTPTKPDAALYGP